MEIKVLSVGRNIENYLWKYFISLQNQTYKDFTGLLILDDPEDGSYNIAARAIMDSGLKITLHRNTVRKGQPRNFYEGVHDLAKNDEDIICIVDGDDQIIPNALQIIDDTYRNNPECLLTYGTYHRTSRPVGDLEFQGAYTSDNFRNVPWKASHMKTFKYKLFKQLVKEDFMYDDKETWFPRSGDQVMMLPMMEIAGLDRIKYIDQVIYELTDAHHPYTENYPEVANGRHVHDIVRSRTPYKRMDI